MAEINDLFQEYSEAFDRLCQERHNAGAVEYGKFTFLQNDVVRMMMEELADTANYCRMQFIKLMMLQHVIEGSLDIDGTKAEFGTEAFKGTGEVGWGK